MCVALLSALHALPSCHLTAQVGYHYDVKRDCTANMKWGQYSKPGILILEPLLRTAVPCCILAAAAGKGVASTSRYSEFHMSRM